MVTLSFTSYRPIPNKYFVAGVIFIVKTINFFNVQFVVFDFFD